MVITYTGKQTEISDEMKEYFEKRLKKVKFYFDQILKINAVMKTQRGKFTVELKVTSGRDSYYADETDSDWKKCFDKVTDKVESEIKKKKDRITDHHKSPTLKK